MKKNLNIIFLPLIVILLTLISCKKETYIDAPNANNILIESIEASSTLIPEDQYSVKNLSDKSRASWSEGVDGDGLYEFFRISFKEIVKIENIFIKNGYGIPSYFKLNNRVRELLIFNENKIKRKLSLADERELIRYTLSEPIIGKQFDFVIKSVYKGALYADTCIAEISFEKINFDSDWNYNIKNYFTQIIDIQEIRGKKFFSEFGEEMTYSSSEFSVDENDNFFSYSISYEPTIEEKIYGSISCNKLSITSKEVLFDEDNKNNSAWETEKLEKKDYNIKLYRGFMKKSKKEYPTWFEYKDYEYTRQKTNFPVLFITDSPVSDLYYEIK